MTKTEVIDTSSTNITPETISTQNAVPNFSIGLKVLSIAFSNLLNEKKKWNPEKIETILDLKEFLPVKRRDIIEWERGENLRVYNQFKAMINKDYVGKYVVIANGKIYAGKSFDDVKDIGLDANHRLIFKVEPEKEVKGTLRWPMKRK